MLRVDIGCMIKSLWASIQGDPVFMRRINGWLTIFWIIMIPVSLATGWQGASGPKRSAPTGRP